MREIQQGGRAQTLLLLEHDPVVTLGRGWHAEHLLRSTQRLRELGVQVFESPRGGDVTYHGPGQIVGYPLLDLTKHGCDLHAYIRSLESVLIDVLDSLGIRASRQAGLTGVWVGPDQRGSLRKIAAIGIRVQRWVTSHGFSLNVDMDMQPFGLIVPCGLHGCAVTSVAAEMGGAPPMEEVIRHVEQSFAKEFRMQIRPADIPREALAESA